MVFIFCLESFLGGVKFSCIHIGHDDLTTLPRTKEHLKRLLLVSWRWGVVKDLGSISWNFQRSTLELEPDKAKIGLEILSVNHFLSINLSRSPIMPPSPWGMIFDICLLSSSTFPQHKWCVCVCVWLCLWREGHRKRKKNDIRVPSVCQSLC